MRTWVYFQAYKNPKVENMRNIQKISETKQKKGVWKIFFGSNTNTEIGPWFRFPIPKPGFGRTLNDRSVKKMLLFLNAQKTSNHIKIK